MPVTLSQKTKHSFDPRSAGASLWCGDDVPIDCDYVEPDDLNRAVAILNEAGGAARIVAGGQSLLPALRSGMLQATQLVSLRRIGMLKKTACEGGKLSIGAEVTFSEYLASSHAEAVPFLTTVVNEVGSHTIRNRTTFGGTIAWANPMGALLLALAMLDGVIVTTRRRLPSVDCISGGYRTNLMVDEIIVAVEIALPPTSRRFAFEKTTARRSGGKALASMAAALELHSDRRRSLRLGVVGLRDRAWVSDWHSCTEIGDLDADVDDHFTQAPLGQRFDPLLPSPAYVRASAALVCRRLVQEMSHA